MAGTARVVCERENFNFSTDDTVQDVEWKPRNPNTTNSRRMLHWKSIRVLANSVDRRVKGGKVTRAKPGAALFVERHVLQVLGTGGLREEVDHRSRD